MTLRIGVLGPVVAWKGDEPVEIGPLKQRSVLAVLAAHLGSEVSTDRIIEAVWGENASPAAKRSVQTYMSNLRNTFGEGGRDLLRGSTTGYSLDPATVTTDWIDFERAAAGNTVVDVELALGLWRGEPFQDVERDWARPLIATWTEQRMHAAERWADLLLREGRAADAIARLEQFVDEHPTRESLWAGLMRALAAAGRKADALAAYQRLRAILSESLGIDPSPELQELEEEILLSDRHAVATSTIGTPIPVPHTRLVGRDDQLTGVTAALSDHRLVTLLGPGGSGKTRLGIEAAHQAGIPAHFVDLSRVSDPDQVPQAVATALGVAIRGGSDPERAPIAQLARAVTDRSLLILLDNCEHVVRAAAEAVSALLSATHGIHVLATSREPLGLPGEHRHQVPPLPIEAGDERPALTLMLERAADATGNRTFTGPEVSALDELAISLEGMPLAMEIAAAQLAYLAPEELLASLSERLTMSAGKGGERRHETLQATMEWSWQLLDDTERTLLSELAVFSGGWTLEAAKGISSLEPSVVRTALGSLVAKSLVLPSQTVWGTRYRFLDTVRLFGRAQLGERKAEVEARHAAWYAEWCASWWLEDHFSSAELSSRLTYDHENLHSALLHHVRHEKSEQAAQIVAAHANTWRGNHRGKEALEWTDLVDPSRLPPVLRCQWMLSRGAALQINDRFADMWALTEEAARLAASTGDTMLIAVAKFSGSYGYLLTDPERHAEAYYDAIEAARVAGSASLEALGYAMQAFGSYIHDEPPAVYNQQVTLAEAVELELGWNRSIQTAASVHIRIANGDLDDALQIAFTNTGWGEMGLLLDEARNSLAIVFAAAVAGRADVWEDALRRSHPHLSISLSGRADGDVLLGFAAWEVFQGDPVRGSELLASVRSGHIEFPETFVKYWDIRNHLVGLDLDPLSVDAARARGAATPMNAAMEAEYERRGWTWVS